MLLKIIGFLLLIYIVYRYVWSYLVPGQTDDEARAHKHLPQNIDHNYKIYFYIVAIQDHEVEKTVDYLKRIILEKALISDNIVLVYKDSRVTDLLDNHIAVLRSLPYTLQKSQYPSTIDPQKTPHQLTIFKSSESRPKQAYNHYVVHVNDSIAKYIFDDNWDLKIHQEFEAYEDLGPQVLFSVSPWSHARPIVENDYREYISYSGKHLLHIPFVSTKMMVYRLNKDFPFAAATTRHEMEFGSDLFVRNYKLLLNPRLPITSKYILRSTNQEFYPPDIKLDQAYINYISFKNGRTSEDFQYEAHYK
jgi:hypothetical protein